MITHRMDTTGYGVVETSPEEIRDTIFAMESGLIEAVKNQPPIEVEVIHEFADGLYLRKILIPKGCAFTGRVHKQNDLQIMFYGDLSILTEHGTMHLTGPNTFTSKAGVKPFAIAHEDTLFATVHHTHLTDLREIEAALFEDETPAVDFITGHARQEVLPCHP